MPIPINRCQCCCCCCYQQKQQIIQSQQSRAEVQSPSQTQVPSGGPGGSEGPSEVLHLQAQLQDSLLALQRHQEPAQLLDDDKVPPVHCV